MKKIIVWGFLCMAICVTAGCTSFVQRMNRERATTVVAPAPAASADVVAAEDGTRSTKSSGYLSEGATVRMDVGEGRSRLSMIEQFEQTKHECVLLQERVEVLDKALTSENAKRSALEAELEALKEQLVTMKQINMENEELRKQLENVQVPYEKKIMELAMELTRAQIEETRAKQELIGFKIETLIERKKQKPHEE